MSYLKIVEKTDGYEGVGRYAPNYTGPHENEEFDELLNWHLVRSTTGELDSYELCYKDKLLKLINFYNTDIEYSQSVKYELIEITEYQEKPSVFSNFLGFDVSSYHQDTLLTIVSSIPEKTDDYEIFEYIHNHKKHDLESFYLLLVNNFKKKINKNLLFDSYEQAYFYYDIFKNQIKNMPSNNGFSDYESYNVLGIWNN